MGNCTLSDDGILRIKSYSWDLVLDLNRVAEEAGVMFKERYFDVYENKPAVDCYVNYPMARAKRLCRLIVENTDDDEIFRKIEGIFSKNTKLAKAWIDTVAKYKR